MLQLSKRNINYDLKLTDYNATKSILDQKKSKVMMRLLLTLSALLLIVLFLPWNQNIRAKGYVTTLRPDQRPQTINSVIAGKIEKWFVAEGDFVKKGDTIVFLSEIKNEYFDPSLLTNVEGQIKAKEMTVNSYMEKVKALDNQIDALVRNSQLKLQQYKNKLEQARLAVSSDSMDLEAAKINKSIALKQKDRIEELYNKGLKSLTDLENKKLSLQKTEAEYISKKNKYLKSQNELINAEVEIYSVQAKFKDDIAKAESNKYTAMSSMYDAEATVTKLQNQYMNYSIRSGYYYITAPQDGYIMQGISNGIGEIIKEGAPIVSIVPINIDFAVEMYVNPMDMPLVRKGQEVRIQFDGWPAIVFSGWPGSSYGTFGGEIYAIDNNISKNGKYRVLVKADMEEKAWPQEIRVGAGTKTFTILNEVPVAYELWRQLNGFPPDYYDEKLVHTEKSESHVKEQK